MCTCWVLGALSPRCLGLIRCNTRPLLIYTLARGQAYDGCVDMPSPRGALVAAVTHTSAPANPPGPMLGKGPRASKGRASAERQGQHIQPFPKGLISTSVAKRGSPASLLPYCLPKLDPMAAGPELQGQEQGVSLLCGCSQITAPLGAWVPPGTLVQTTHVVAAMPGNVCVQVPSGALRPHKAIPCPVGATAHLCPACLLSGPARHGFNP